MTLEKLILLYNGQKRSTDMWIAQWEKNKDITGVRNAAMAIGKLAGIHQVMVALGQDLPDEIIDAMCEYNDIWARI